MPVPQPVHLSATDHARLAVFVHRGKANVRTLKRAQVLLKLGAGWRSGAVAEACGVSATTVLNVRRRFLRDGVEGVLTDKQQEHRRAALTGAQQAHLIAIACSAAPAGHDHWTLRLLAGKAVELGFVERVAIETIRSLLKRTSSNRGSITSGVSPR